MALLRSWDNLHLQFHRRGRCFLVLVLLALPLSATTHYVDCNGSDSNDGTNTSTPWQTLSKVNTSSLNVGDQVLFRSGCIWRGQLTNTSSGAAGNNIIYGAYGTGALPSIRGSKTYDSAGNWTNESGNLWYASSIASDPGVFVHDGLLGSRKTAKINLVAQWNYWYDSPNKRLYVYSTANPTSLATNLEIPAYSMFQGGFVWWSHITYQNLDIRHYYGPIAIGHYGGIDIGYSGITCAQVAQYCIQYNHGSFGSVTSSSFVDWGVVDGQNYAIQAVSDSITSGPVDVTNCTFIINHSFNNTELGVMSDTMGWIRNFTGNSCTNNGKWPGSCFWVWRPGPAATAITIQNNAAYRMGNGSFGIDDVNGNGATPTITASYNYMEDSDQFDLLDTEALRVRSFNFSTPVTVSYNVINRTKSGSNGHPGIYLYGATNARIYGNTVVGADDGLLVKAASSGNDVRNNISAFNRGHGIDVQDTSTVTTFDHNLFYSNASANYSGISASTGDVTTDPKFTNRAGNDLTLQAGSLAISAGANLGLTYEFGLDPRTSFPWNTLNQNSLGPGWEVGAFVFVQQIPPAPTLLTVTVK